MLRQAMSPFIIYLFLTAYSLKCYECKPHGKCEGNSKGEPDTVCPQNPVPPIKIPGLDLSGFDPICLKGIDADGKTRRECAMKSLYRMFGLKNDTECHYDVKVPEIPEIPGIPDAVKFQDLPDSFKELCLCSTDNCNGCGMMRSKSTVLLAGITLATCALKWFVL